VLSQISGAFGFSDLPSPGTQPFLFSPGAVSQQNVASFTLILEDEFKNLTT